MIKLKQEKVKEWLQAEPIQRWETADLDYEFPKETSKAKLLRYAYKACYHDANG